MIDKLTDVYNKWGDDNNLQPLGSADEELLGRENLTKEQREWLEKFIEMWDNQQDIDCFIYENTKKEVIKDHQFEINADGSESDSERYGKKGEKR